MSVDAWRRLLEDHGALVDAARDLIDSNLPIQPADIVRLRAGSDAELVALALDLARARRKARGKFPDTFTRLVADATGVEQATSALVADHKALRFDPGDDHAIVDLCCGVGGDLMALARRGTDVHGVDLDPVRAWMSSRNAGCPTSVEDVTDLPVADRLVHLDPSRRDAEGRRRHAYDDLVPPPAVLERILTEARGAALKLGPGVDLDRLPLPHREIEIVSEHGTLVQAILWAGTLARHADERTATRLPENVSFTGVPCPLPLDSGVREFLYVPDPALERTDLVGARCAAVGADPGEIHRGLGLMTSDERFFDPWFTTYEVLSQLPWRLERMRTAVKELAGGRPAEIIVRTRGKAIDTDIVQRDLQSRLRSGPAGTTGAPLTVFGLRLGQRKIAVIGERLTGDVIGEA